MRILPPKQAAYQTASDFNAFVAPYLREERAVCGFAFAAEKYVSQDFYALELKACRLSGLVFDACMFEKSSFMDVLFIDCNFSGCDFSDSFFERCRFENCKAVGTNFQSACLKHTEICDSNFSYAVFDRASALAVRFSKVNFREASFAEMKWKHMQMQGCAFVQNNFFKSTLAGLDFSACELLAPTVSADGAELRGICIDAAQAADLIGVFGIRIQQP